MLALRMDGAAEGLVKAVGGMVRTRCGQNVLRSRKVVRTILEDVGGGVDTLQVCHIATKTNYLVTSRFPPVFGGGFEKMFASSSVTVTSRACFRTYRFAFFKVSM